MVDVSQAVRMLKRRRRQFIKDVVGADFKPRTKVISWIAPVAALAPLCSDLPEARSR